ncbi:hypothetical protein Acr_21g0010550 [Actinidia rufa]|uniref:Uncharacterized protein n=1 Tax=Actinidia rufa TaxID=165716 RepID=A0A7J0GI24_9ERIC|nr:hypothetical protein Acr_21g0010550 [Actinidia rufa]
MADKEVAKPYPGKGQSRAEIGQGSKSKVNTVIPPPKKSVIRMMGESVKSSAVKFKNKPKISPGAGSA